uniref:Major sperm protein n=1 Tax=Trichuris muris TaxID=70415 RepID=A0A5S6Q9Q1_TRIMR
MLSTYLTNDGRKRIAVKIRTTDNNIFRVNKVYFLLAPGEKAELQLYLLPLGLQFNFLCRNHITVIYGPISSGVKTAKNAWRSMQQMRRLTMRVTIEKPRKGDPVAKEITAVEVKKHFDRPVAPTSETANVRPTGKSKRMASIKDLVTPTSIFDDCLEPSRQDQKADTLETLPGAGTVKPGLPEAVKPQDKISHIEDITLKTAELIDDKLTQFEPVRTEKHVDESILLTGESANAESSEAKRDALMKDMVTVTSIWDDHSESTSHDQMGNKLEALRASATAIRPESSLLAKSQQMLFHSEEAPLKTAEVIDDKFIELEAGETKRYHDGPVSSTGAPVIVGASGEGKRDASLKDMVTPRSIWEDHLESSSQDGMAGALDVGLTTAVKPGLSEAAKPCEAPFRSEGVTVKTAEMMDEKLTTDFEILGTKEHFHGPVPFAGRSITVGASAEGKQETSIKDVFTTTSILDDHFEQSTHGRKSKTLDVGAASAGKGESSEASKSQSIPFLSDAITVTTAQVMDENFNELETTGTKKFDSPAPQMEESANLAASREGKPQASVHDMVTVTSIWDDHLDLGSQEKMETSEGAKAKDMLFHTESVTLKTAQLIDADLTDVESVAAEHLLTGVASLTGQLTNVGTPEQGNRETSPKDMITAKSIWDDYSESSSHARIASTFDAIPLAPADGATVKTAEMFDDNLANIQYVVAEKHFDGTAPSKVEPANVIASGVPKRESSEDMVTVTSIWRDHSELGSQTEVANELEAMTAPAPVKQQESPQAGNLGETFFANEGITLKTADPMEDKLTEMLTAEARTKTDSTIPSMRESPYDGPLEVKMEASVKDMVTAKSIHDDGSDSSCHGRMAGIAESREALFHREEIPVKTAETMDDKLSEMLTAEARTKTDSTILSMRESPYMGPSEVKTDASVKDMVTAMSIHDDRSDSSSHGRMADTLQPTSTGATIKRESSGMAKPREALFNREEIPVRTADPMEDKLTEMLTAEARTKTDSTIPSMRESPYEGPLEVKMEASVKDMVTAKSIHDDGSHSSSHGRMADILQPTSTGATIKRESSGMAKPREALFNREEIPVRTAEIMDDKLSEMLTAEARTKTDSTVPSMRESPYLGPLEVKTDASVKDMVTAMSIHDDRSHSSSHGRMADTLQPTSTGPTIKRESSGMAKPREALFNREEIPVRTAEIMDDKLSEMLTAEARTKTDSTVPSMRESPYLGPLEVKTDASVKDMVTAMSIHDDRSDSSSHGRMADTLQPTSTGPTIKRESSGMAKPREALFNREEIPVRTADPMEDKLTEMLTAEARTKTDSTIPSMRESPYEGPLEVKMEASVKDMVTAKSIHDDGSHSSSHGRMADILQPTSTGATIKRESSGMAKPREALFNREEIPVRTAEIMDDKLSEMLTAEARTKTDSTAPSMRESPYVGPSEVKVEASVKDIVTAKSIHDDGSDSSCHGRMAGIAESREALFHREEIPVKTAETMDDKLSEMLTAEAGTKTDSTIPSMRESPYVGPSEVKTDASVKDMVTAMSIHDDRSDSSSHGRMADTLQPTSTGPTIKRESSGMAKPREALFNREEIPVKTAETMDDKLSEMLTAEARTKTDSTIPSMRESPYVGPLEVKTDASVKDMVTAMSIHDDRADSSSHGRMADTLQPTSTGPTIKRESSGMAKPREALFNREEIPVRTAEIMDDKLSEMLTAEARTKTDSTVPSMRESPYLGPLEVKTDASVKDMVTAMSIHDDRSDSSSHGRMADTLQPTSTGPTIKRESSGMAKPREALFNREEIPVRTAEIMDDKLSEMLTAEARTKTDSTVPSMRESPYLGPLEVKTDASVKDMVTAMSIHDDRSDSSSHGRMADTLQPTSTGPTIKRESSGMAKPREALFNREEIPVRTAETMDDKLSEMLTAEARTKTDSSIPSVREPPCVGSSEVKPEASVKDMVTAKSIHDDGSDSSCHGRMAGMAKTREALYHGEEIPVETAEGMDEKLSKLLTAETRKKTDSSMSSMRQSPYVEPSGEVRKEASVNDMVTVTSFGDDHVESCSQGRMANTLEVIPVVAVRAGSLEAAKSQDVTLHNEGISLKTAEAMDDVLTEFEVRNAPILNAGGSSDVRQRSSMDDRKLMQ